jgi:hemoglobin-like flavoprotein
MGMGASNPRLAIEETMVLMMPLYYTKDDITEADIANCQATWNGILHDSLPSFIALKGTPGFPHESCRSWFYYTFYNRLMETQPHTRGLFVNGVDTVGIFMVKMLSMCLTQLQKKTEYENTLKALALRHCQRGILVNEYFFFGEVLFYAIRTVGGDAYTAEVDVSWKRIYSSMLKIIVPECLQFGLAMMNDPNHNGSSSLRNRQENQSSSHPEAKNVNTPQEALLTNAVAAAHSEKNAHV